MSSTGIAAPPAPHRPQVSAGRLTPRSSSTISTVAADGLDRDQLLDRLQHLRTILPVFAQELATARRHTAQLRKDNRRLLDELHRLGVPAHKSLHTERADTEAHQRGDDDRSRG